MTKFIVGFIFGVVVATVGLQGIANMANKAVPVVDSKIKDAQSYVKEQAK